MGLVISLLVQLLQACVLDCVLPAAVQLDDVMGTATAVGGNLGEQSRLFDNIGNKVLTASLRFPAVNTLLNAIRRKKNRVRC